MSSVEQDIFRRGSTTYYWSSKFFPKAVRNDVFKLYSFVRVADNYVDSIPQDSRSFGALRILWNESVHDEGASTTIAPADDISQRVVKNMLAVVRKYNMDPAWVEAFLDSMQMDIDGKQYESLADTLAYIYGSAEVIGLMMAKIMELPEEAYEYAKLQGRAMQWINFLRDINEDISLGRRYIPAKDLELFGVSELTPETARLNTESFTKLMQFELKRYEEWQTEANKGFRYIPKRLLVPLKTAVDMYNWTAHQIASDPTIVFKTKVKPAKSRVVTGIAKNSLQKSHSLSK